VSGDTVDMNEASRPIAPITARSLDALPRTGDRVVLRRLLPEDLAQFQAYRHEKTLGQFQGWSPQSDAEAMAFLEEMRGAALFRPGHWIQLGIAERGNKVLIGDIGLRLSGDAAEAEVGVTISTRAQGHGLATASVREAIALVLEHTEVSRIVAITDARNLASIRLLERVGMRRVATRTAVFRREPCVEHVYAISREDVDDP
jgi:RimJ/RimL family protein N-acetyltransferase